MSDKDKPTDAAPAKPKGKLKKLMLPLVAVLVLGGGGAAAGYFLGMGSSADTAHADPDAPQLVPKSGDHAESAESGKAEDGKPEPAHAIDKSRFEATYYPVETPFTSNLKDSDAFVQVSLGVSTYYDARVTDAVKAHEMALRSAILLRLSEQDELVLATPQGKAMLQKDLTQVVNQVLRERTGFGGIDNVYFTAFVVQ